MPDLKKVRRVSVLPHVEFGSNENREDATNFSVWSWKRRPSVILSVTAQYAFQKCRFEIYHLDPLDGLRPGPFGRSTVISFQILLFGHPLLQSVQFSSKSFEPFTLILSI